MRDAMSEVLQSVPGAETKGPHGGHQESRLGEEQRRCANSAEGGKQAKKCCSESTVKVFADRSRKTWKTQAHCIKKSISRQKSPRFAKMTD